MKRKYRNTIFILLQFLIVFSCTSLQAQRNFHLGIKGGMDFIDLKNKTIEITSTPQKFTINFYRNQVFLNAGIFAQGKIGLLTIQPEVLLSLQSAEYLLKNVDTTATVQENYINLELPFLIGLTTGPIRLLAGPVFTLPLDYTSNINQFIDARYINYQFQNLNYGWQAGVGLDLWKFSIDARFGGDFHDFGNHFTFNGQNYDFDASQIKLIIQVGFRFI